MASNKIVSDDDKYISLMGKYKELRRTSGPEANKYLKAAMKLRAEGNVSDDVALGSAYL